MTTGTRNASFRQEPFYEHRLGRFKTDPAVAPIAQFAPVSAAGETQDPSDLRLDVRLAAAASAPIIGLTGVIRQENPWDAYTGYDSVLTRASDLHFCRVGEQAQVCHGTETKVLVQNTPLDDYEGQREYAARNMFNPTDLAALSVGHMVTPGAGDDTDGYWKKTTDATKSWGTVIEVDRDYGLVVFQLSF